MNRTAIGSTLGVGQLQAFGRDGYLVVTRSFGDPLLEELTGEVDSLIDRKPTEAGKVGDHHYVEDPASLPVVDRVLRDCGFFRERGVGVMLGPDAQGGHARLLPDPPDFGPGRPVLGPAGRRDAGALSSCPQQERQHVEPLAPDRVLPARRCRSSSALGGNDDRFTARVRTGAGRAGRASADCAVSDGGPGYLERWPRNSPDGTAVVWMLTL